MEKGVNPLRLLSYLNTALKGGALKMVLLLTNTPGFSGLWLME